MRFTRLCPWVLLLAGFKGKKGIWILRLGHAKKSLEEIRASGSLNPDVLLDWIFEWKCLEMSEETRIRELLAKEGR
jgi:hypothetical protein